MAKILSPVFISCLFIFIANVVNCNLNYRIKRSNSLSSSDHHHQQHHIKPSIVYERRQNLTAIRLAYEHLNQIRTHYRCGTPRPTLIRVKDIYNVPSKEYLPRWEWDFSQITQTVKLSPSKIVILFIWQIVCKFLNDSIAWNMLKTSQSWTLKVELEQKIITKDFYVIIHKQPFK